MSDWVGLTITEYAVLKVIRDAGPIWYDRRNSKVLNLLRLEMILVARATDDDFLCIITTTGHKHLADHTAILIYDMPC